MASNLSRRRILRASASLPLLASAGSRLALPASASFAARTATAQSGAWFLRGGSPCLEAQIANLADEIAYGNHDVDDGLRAGLIDVGGLQTVDLFARHCREVTRRYPELVERRLVHETIRRMISELIEDLIAETARRISESGVQSLADVRAVSPIAAFSAPIRRDLTQLKRLPLCRLIRRLHQRQLSQQPNRVNGRLKFGWGRPSGRNC